MTSCELKRWSSDFPPSKTRVAHTRNFPPKERDLVLSCARAIVTFHIGLHEMCVRTGVLYVITKFSEEDSLPNFLTHGAPLRARFARARSSAMNMLRFQATNSARSHWLLRHHMTADNETVSRQNL